MTNVVRRKKKLALSTRVVQGINNDLVNGSGEATDKDYNYISESNIQSRNSLVNKIHSKVDNAKNNNNNNNNAGVLITSRITDIIDDSHDYENTDDDNSNDWTTTSSSTNDYSNAAMRRRKGRTIQHDNYSNSSTTSEAHYSTNANSSSLTTNIASSEMSSTEASSTTYLLEKKDHSNSRSGGGRRKKAQGGETTKTGKKKKQKRKLGSGSIGHYRSSHGNHDYAHHHRHHRKGGEGRRNRLLLVLEFNKQGEHQFRDMTRGDLLRECRGKPLSGGTPLVSGGSHLSGGNHLSARSLPAGSSRDNTSLPGSTIALHSTNKNNNNLGKVGGLVQSRDIRLLDPSFETFETTADILVRRGAILIVTEQIKGIILHDKVLIVVPSGADGILSYLFRHLRRSNKVQQRKERRYHELEQKKRSLEEEEKLGGEGVVKKKDDLMIHGGEGNGEENGEENHSSAEAKANHNDDHDEIHNDNKDFGEDNALGDHLEAPGDHLEAPGDHFEDEDNHLTTDDVLGIAMSAGIPFEYRALECMMETVIRDFEIRLDRMLPIVDGTLKKLRENAGSVQTQLSLAAVKHDTADLDVRVRTVLDELQEVLDSDEDLALMSLTKLFRQPSLFEKPNWQDDHEDAELLLESFLQKTQILVMRLDLLSRDIKNMEDSVNMRLNVLRNRLLKIEVLFSTFATAFTGISVVTGAFGMNLKSGIEDGYGSDGNLWWFWGTFIGLIGAGALVIAAMFSYYIHVGIIGGRVM
eukprot:g2012.t1